MRMLIDLPNAQIRELAAFCEQAKQTRAAVIREAVAEYLERRVAKPVDTAFGLWGANKMDGMAYQDKARAEW